ncbi:hypothetical protein QF046_001799 [Microbacterium sp. W4I4]|uniref:hypothetical protein n=1 Tax=Microbacterium sp. W4I4 TaxID=3042295 RepID=UPI00278193C9|nr:hypothetical protein [Microbacterium sp. W4I4]MDQ0614158.1 hypothetical protein [Microbacterium sp. W4I4]
MRIHRRTLSKAVLAALLSAPILWAAPLPASAVQGTESSESSAQAELSVTLTADQDVVRSGDEVTLTATVSNTGTVEVPVRTVLELPPYVSVADASDGDVEGSHLTWEVTLGAAQEQTWEADVVIGSIPDGEVRVTSVLSAFVGDQERALVRTAHAASIHGVADTPRPIPVDAVEESTVNLGLIAVIAVPVVLLGGGGLWWWRRRARAEAAASAG